MFGKRRHAWQYNHGSYTLNRFLLLLAVAALMWPDIGAAQRSGFRDIAPGKEKRVALVVAMSRYQHVTALENPRNDARLMADTLIALGFSLVGGGAQVDLDKAGFDRIVQTSECSCRVQTWACSTLLVTACRSAAQTGWFLFRPIRPEYRISIFKWWTPTLWCARWRAAVRASIS